jgi:hypothetical protein
VDGLPYPWMIKLGRLRDWTLPELIYLDPIVATACCCAVAEDATHANARRLARVPGAPRASTDKTCGNRSFRHPYYHIQ